jgi:hypothetical protein
MDSIDQKHITHPTDTPGQFIQEYPGGRRVLVSIDPHSGKETFIREL